MTRFPRTPVRTGRARPAGLLVGLATLALALTACGSDGTSVATPSSAAPGASATGDGGSAAPTGSGPIVIGAFNFSESAILASMYEQVLDKAGFDASIQTSTNREVLEPALESGSVDVVPEYLGTVTEFLNKKQNGPDATTQATSDVETTESALTALAGSVGLEPLTPSEAADQNAFAVTSAFATENNLTTLSDLAALGEPVSWAARRSARTGRSASRGWRRPTG